MHHKSQRRQNSTGALIGICLLMTTLLMSMICALLIGFAVLRENQAFWTYAGGYPDLLREIVSSTFLPLYGGSVLVLLGLTLACLSKFCRSLSFFVGESMLLLFCWTLLATSGFIAFKNNVVNILNGSPLHRHQK